MFKKMLLLILSSISYGFYANAVEVKYNIDIDPTTKTINGNQVQAFLLNGSSPGPIIKAEIGDTLNITINNKTQKDLIIHWHGLMVPNDQDGVAFVTTKIISAGTNFTYNFPVKQTGTYWYHAHGLEEAQGIYGAIVLNNPEETFPDSNVLLYTGELDKNPEDVLKELTKNEISTMDHSAHMSMSSNTEEEAPMEMDHSKMNHAQTNQGQMIDKTNGEKMKMGRMMTHYSDVTYAEHLINGQNQAVTITEIQDNKVKLRIINAYVDGFLNFVYSGGKITVVSSDGLDVKPVAMDNLRVAMGETYDIILDVKDNKSYELVSFFMGSNEYSKVIIGNGELVPIRSLDVNDYSRKQPYTLLETITPEYLDFKKFNNVQKHNFSLEGDHDNYNWRIEEKGKILERLNVKVGDKIKVKILNNTMMPHPMHLHGTFFKVNLTKPSNNLIKHTINLDPMETVEIEFIIDEEGNWLFHCHNLFHMATGMMITIEATK